MTRVRSRTRGRSGTGVGLVGAAVLSGRTDSRSWPATARACSDAIHSASERTRTAIPWSAVTRSSTSWAVRSAIAATPSSRAASSGNPERPEQPHPVVWVVGVGAHPAVTCPKNPDSGANPGTRAPRRWSAPGRSGTTPTPGAGQPRGPPGTGEREPQPERPPATAPHREGAGQGGAGREHAAGVRGRGAPRRAPRRGRGPERLTQQSGSPFDCMPVRRTAAQGARPLTPGGSPGVVLRRVAAPPRRGDQRRWR